jgi:hypothetical protein
MELSIYEQNIIVCVSSSYKVETDFAAQMLAKWPIRRTKTSLKTMIISNLEPKTCEDIWTTPILIIFLASFHSNDRKIHENGFLNNLVHISKHICHKNHKMS